MSETKESEEKELKKKMIQKWIKLYFDLIDAREDFAEKIGSLNYDHEPKN